jgi:hypothetical protein
MLSTYLLAYDNNENAKTSCLLDDYVVVDNKEKDIYVCTLDGLRWKSFYNNLNIRNYSENSAFYAVEHGLSGYFVTENITQGIEADKVDVKKSIESALKLNKVVSKNITLKYFLEDIVLAKIFKVRTNKGSFIFKSNLIDEALLVVDVRDNRKVVITLETVSLQY